VDTCLNGIRDVSVCIIEISRMRDFISLTKSMCGSFMDRIACVERPCCVSAILCVYNGGFGGKFQSQVVAILYFGRSQFIVNVKFC
jgi:hypothetical protein